MRKKWSHAYSFTWVIWEGQYLAHICTTLAHLSINTGNSETDKQHTDWYQPSNSRYVESFDKDLSFNGAVSSLSLTRILILLFLFLPWAFISCVLCWISQYTEGQCEGAENLHCIYNKLWVNKGTMMVQWYQTIRDLPEPLLSLSVRLSATN